MAGAARATPVRLHASVSSSPVSHVRITSIAACYTQALEQAEGLAELLVIILRTCLLAWLGLGGWFVRAAVAVAQVTEQIGFLVALAIATFVGDLGAAYFDVRHNALGLDRATIGRVVQRRGDLDGAVIGQRQHGLHRAFTEAVGAHQDAAFVVLQGAGDDFRGRGAAAVDQHHQWHAFAFVLAVDHEAQFGVGDTALGVHDQAAGQEVISHFHRCLQYAAGVVTQVQYQTAHFLTVVFAQFGQGSDDFFTGLDLELSRSEIAVAVLQHLRFHALDLDSRPGEGHVEGRAAFANQGQSDFFTQLAAHLVDRVLHGLALGRCAVDLDDKVTGFDARFGGRGVIDGRDDLDHAVLDTDFDAQAAEFAAGAFLKLLEIFRAQVGGRS